MNIIRIDSPLSDRERAEICFRGDIVIYQKIDAMLELIEYSDDRLRQALGGINPTTAQQTIGPDEFLKVVGEVQISFRQSDQAKAIFFKALAQCGVDLASTFYDHFPMRIVPFGATYQGARCSQIGHHRDTWGGNIYSQLNWWAPLYELNEQRTIAIYPKYWESPVKNSSADWSFETFIKQRQESVKDNSIERRIDYPSTPLPLEEFDESDAVKLLLSPGDILNFSSAHLHASVPNNSSKTRYSVEMRTINSDDLNTGRAAHNVDNAGKRLMYQWFKNIRTKQVLDSFV